MKTEMVTKYFSPWDPQWLPNVGLPDQLNSNVSEITPNPVLRCVNRLWEVSGKCYKPYDDYKESINEVSIAFLQGCLLEFLLLLQWFDYRQ